MNTHSLDAPSVNASLDAFTHAYMLLGMSGVYVVEKYSSAERAGSGFFLPLKASASKHPETPMFAYIHRLTWRVHLEAEKK